METNRNKLIIYGGIIKMINTIKTVIVILAALFILSGCTGSDKEDGTITVGFSQIGAES